MNSVNIIGRMTKDPELRNSKNGKEFVGFSVAVNKKDKEGNQYTTFIECYAWNKTAQLLCNTSKGDLVGLSGSIAVMKDKEERNKTYVLVQSITFTKKKSNSESNNREQYPPEPERITDEKDFPW